MNVALLRGTLSSEPQARSLPSGDELVEYQVTTRRADQPADSVPVVWFDPPVAAGRLAEGDEVVVVGRIRRRWFRAGGATQSRTEIVADAVVASRQAARSRAAVARALRAVTAAEAEPVT